MLEKKNWPNVGRIKFNIGEKFCQWQVTKGSKQMAPRAGLFGGHLDDIMAAT